MNNKFYVSLEVARLLKEKGYDEDYGMSYNEKGEMPLPWDNQDDMIYPAPTKSEAIDWLESKGITIDIHFIKSNENRRWNYSIFDCNTCDIIDTNYIYLTRLEAEDAAIIKALELL